MIITTATRNNYVLDPLNSFKIPTTTKQKGFQKSRRVMLFCHHDETKHSFATTKKCQREKI